MSVRRPSDLPFAIKVVAVVCVGIAMAFIGGALWFAILATYYS